MNSFNVIFFFLDKTINQKKKFICELDNGHVR